MHNFNCYSFYYMKICIILFIFVLLHYPFRALEVQNVLATNREKYADKDDLFSFISMSEMKNSLPFDNPNGGVWKQGFPITIDMSEDFPPDSKPLQVHVIPWSHNDPGWRLTFSEYFNKQSRFILDNFVEALSSDSNRYAIWPEVCILDRWWQIASSGQKDQMRKLVQSGQMEIVTGGWVMQEEAVAHYESMINQLFVGHEWLRTHFAVTPNVSFSIDPFGHSPVMSFLLRRAGINSAVIHRVHYAVKRELALFKNLEFFWSPTWDADQILQSKGLEINDGLLTHMLPFYSYNIPHTCGPEPKICAQFDFSNIGMSTPWGDMIKPLPEDKDELENRALTLVDQYRKHSKLFRTHHLLIILGQDFTYDKKKNLNDQLTSYEKLFDTINDQSNWQISIRFSNLSDYFKGVWQDIRNDNVVIPTLTGDFFPYSDIDDDYWVGFYTSRPFFKRADRLLASSLRAAEILYVLCTLYEIDTCNTFPNFETIQEIRRASALFQHHDAVTGTSSSGVVDDYTSFLHNARWKANNFILNAIMSLSMPKWREHMSEIDVQHDEEKGNHRQLPIPSILNLSKGSIKAISFFNPLAVDRKEIVSILISSPKIVVYDDSGKPIASQINPIWDFGANSLHLASEKFELFFEVYLRPLGTRTYSIQYDEGTNFHPFVPEILIIGEGSNKSKKFLGTVIKSQGFMSKQSLNIGNHFLHVGIDSNTGLLSSLGSASEPSQLFEEDFLLYSSKNSGPYLFKPTKSIKVNIQDEHTNIAIITKGKLVEEITTSLPYVIRTARLFLSNVQEIGAYLQIRNIVDVKKHDGEYVVRFHHSLKNKETFYTDVNGFNIEKRKFRSDLPMPSNYYPINSILFLQDELNSASRRINFLTRQPLGGTCNPDNYVELMLDRRVPRDDGRGLGSGISDNTATDVTIFITFEKSPTKESKFSSEASLFTRTLERRLNHPLNHISSNPQDHIFQGDNMSYKSLFSSINPLKNAIQQDFHLVSLKVRDPISHPGQFVLHIAHTPVDSILSNSFASDIGGKIINMTNILRCVDMLDFNEESLTLMHSTGNSVPKVVFSSKDDIRTFSFHVSPIDYQCVFNDFGKGIDLKEDHSETKMTVAVPARNNIGKPFVAEMPIKPFSSKIILFYFRILISSIFGILALISYRTRLINQIQLVVSVIILTIVNLILWK